MFAPNRITNPVYFIAVAGAAYFIVADKTILATARRNSFKQSSVSNIEE